eukprot:TRINITY_DN27273_c0_g1_i1.p1 TRINITY_DN27273_c0_g1~~TRINITY_DN27273_c0_g1_i1.p1  ORF type:complete len:373 (-),score=58.88 TRINITY_DN27273_c0_g1_i1:57-1175(-)
MTGRLPSRARNLTVQLTLIVSRSVQTARDAKIVRLSYNDLKKGVNLGAQIEEAYGPNGLGILTVSDIPNYLELRLNLLKLAQPLANLPDHVKKSLEHEGSTYQFGWSHGKEKFNNQPDLLKGSYYANPQKDVPTNDPELIKNYPTICTPNIWPKESDLPGFQAAFKTLGQLIVNVGLLVAKEADRHIASKNIGYEPKLHRIINTSRACKARLLHYFPPQIQEKKDNKDIDWCGWHTDHGSLTGLTRALYTDAKGNPIENPDPDCGLYIRDRTGTPVKASIPEKELAFQLGDSSQIQTGSYLQATPHYVKIPNPDKMKGIARNTFAVFMQPEWHEPLSTPAKADTARIKRDVAYWTPGMTFADFMKAKIAEYY